MAFDFLKGPEELMRAGVDSSIDEFDPEFLERLLPLMEKYTSWFDAEVVGFDRLPPKDEEPFLLIGNHSGGALTPDTSAFFCAWYRERGIENPFVGLAFNLAFAIPQMGRFFRRIGEVPASMKNAEAALAAGYPVLVYPGGDFDTYRPWTERNKIDFDGRKGFIRLALRQGVKVVPVVSHGGHHTLFVVTRGEGLARRMGLERLNTKIFPFAVGPIGVTPALIGPQPPLPAKITVDVGEPFDWTARGPEAADDDEFVDACYDEVVTTMQATLDALVAEHPLPLAEGVISKLVSASRWRPSLPSLPRGREA